MIDQSKSLADLSGMDWGEPPESVGSRVQERYVWHRLPMSELPNTALIRFLENSIDLTWVVPVAIERIEQNNELVGLLSRVLGATEYSWIGEPDLVHRVRACVANAIQELGEWDGSESIAREAQQNEVSIYRNWAHFELALSSIPQED